MRFRAWISPVIAVVLAIGSAHASAASSVSPVSPAHAYIDRIVMDSAGVGESRLARVFVFSPSMQKQIQVQVLLPQVATGPRPTLYMLSGLGEEDPENSMWLRKSDARHFFADKKVNVVLPLAGPGSFYTDWRAEDPVLGRYKWETFLTDELPPLMNTAFDGNGANAVAGLSMGAQSALMLAVRNPGFYRAVASYSGCYTSGDALGQVEMRTIVAAFGGNADNMFGGFDDPAWQDHDVLARAENLRGTAVYVSVGTGLPGPHETPSTTNLANQVVVGGLIEAASNYCTHRLDDTLAHLGITATFDYTPTGTHSWGYWADQLPISWPVIAKALA